MNPSARLPRVALAMLSAIVAVTALAGGSALVLGAVVPAWATVLSPPVEALEGSPFSSYVVPGVVLGGVVGGTQVLCAALVLRRHRQANAAAAVAAFGLLIWIFVQMVFIPFSFLQALYFAAALAELGLLLLMLGIFTGRDAGQTP